MLDMVEMYSNRTSLSLNDELAVPAITFSRTFPGLFRPGKVASTRRAIFDLCFNTPPLIVRLRGWRVSPPIMYPYFLCYPSILVPHRCPPPLSPSPVPNSGTPPDAPPILHHSFPLPTTTLLFPSSAHLVPATSDIGSCLVVTQCTRVQGMCTCRRSRVA